MTFKYLTIRDLDNHFHSLIYNVDMRLFVLFIIIEVHVNDDPVKHRY